MCHRVLNTRTNTPQPKVGAEMGDYLHTPRPPLPESFFFLTSGFSAMCSPDVNPVFIKQET